MPVKRKEEYLKRTEIYALVMIERTQRRIFPSACHVVTLICPLIKDEMQFLTQEVIRQSKGSRLVFASVAYVKATSAATGGLQ